MSLKIIHLRKLLKIIYSDPNRRVAALRSDIREDIARELGQNGGGGDFYGPFWHDAKDHVFGKSDLTDSIKSRIDSNPARANLYPRLMEGFLVWWNDRRRWTNEPFRLGDNVKGRFEFGELDATVKVENILAVNDAYDDERFIYPYFSPDPILKEEAARLGLWVMTKAFPDVPPGQFHILDVIRGQTFSIDKNPLNGDEQYIFTKKYEAAIVQWNELRREYDRG